MRGEIYLCMLHTKRMQEQHLHQRFWLPKIVFCNWKTVLKQAKRNDENIHLFFLHHRVFHCRCKCCKCSLSSSRTWGGGGGGGDQLEEGGDGGDGGDGGGGDLMHFSSSGWRPWRSTGRPWRSGRGSSRSASSHSTRRTGRCSESQVGQEMKKKRDHPTNVEEGSTFGLLRFSSH